MKVLVADDSPVVRHAVSALLTDAGIEAVLAEDGIEAIQKFYAERPDLVLLDIQMPKMTGWVACRLLKDDWEVANIPVLILTAHDTAEDRYWSAKSGADGYLTKDSLGEGLLDAIRSAHASRALSELSGQQAKPQGLDQMDVLTRVTEMLDRKLFETTIVNDIVTMAAHTTELRATLTKTMFILRRFVHYDLAGMALISDKLLVTRADRPVDRNGMDLFRRLTVGHVEQLSGLPASPEEFVIWRADNDERMEMAGTDDGWPSFFAMALRSRGETIAVLALAAQRPSVFTPDTAKTLRMVEYPLAAVVDSAIHHQRQLEQEARASLSSLYASPDEA